MVTTANWKIVMNACFCKLRVVLDGKCYLDGNAYGIHAISSELNFVRLGKILSEITVFLQL